ncbi:MAG: hypothetical protein P8Z79_22430 [Sedimentisphaerales bacterium]
MRKKSMILGSALLVIGGVSLWWGLAETWKERDEVARCQAKYSTETDDYMKQYNEWLRLPADERTTFPLLLDRNGKTKTRAQLKQEQRERLKADLEKLASAQTKVPAFADVLYGENWPAEIDAYKKGHLRLVVSAGRREGDSQGSGSRETVGGDIEAGVCGRRRRDDGSNRSDGYTARGAGVAAAQPAGKASQDPAEIELGPLGAHSARH